MPAHPLKRLRLTATPRRRRRLRSRWNRTGCRGNRNGCGGRRRRMRRDDALPDIATRRRWLSASGRRPAVAHVCDCLRGKSGGRTDRRLQRGDDVAGNEVGYRPDGKRPQRSAPCGEKEQRQPNRSGGEPYRGYRYDLGDWRSHFHAPQAAQEGYSHSSGRMVPFPAREEVASSFRRVTDGFLLRIFASHHEPPGFSLTSMLGSKRMTTGDKCWPTYPRCLPQFLG
jgi:hypothetical protein